MSELLRIAVVTEGPTDAVVLKAAIGAIVGDRPFMMTQLQPDDSVALLGSAGPHGGGWKGVGRWCLQTLERNGGRIHDDLLFTQHDLLIIHLDADVAGEKPGANS